MITLCVFMDLKTNCLKSLLLSRLRCFTTMGEQTLPHVPKKVLITEAIWSIK